MRDLERARGDVEVGPRRVVARFRLVEDLRADERGRELRRGAIERGPRVVERDACSSEARTLLLDQRRRLRGVGAGTPATDTSVGRLPLRQELAEELRQHLAPGDPVVPPGVVPRVDAVRDALRTEHALDVPALLRILELALPVREQDEALPEQIEMRTIEVRQTSPNVPICGRPEGP